MCIDSIGSHRLVEWYACIPKVLLDAKNKTELVPFIQGYKAQARESSAPHADMFLDLVTCRVACKVSFFAIVVQPAAAHWVLLQEIPNKTVRMLPNSSGEEALKDGTCVAGLMQAYFKQVLQRALPICSRRMFRESKKHCHPLG